MTQNTDLRQPHRRQGRGAGQLARLQRRILMVVWLLALVWLMGLWRYSPFWAVASAAFFLFGFVPVLALEFVLMQRVNRLDPAPRAGVFELLSAWLHECWMVVKVFVWRQPFAPNAVPDQLEGSRLQGRRGVVFIHGLVCNRGFWTPWLRRLHGKHHAFAAVNLEPVFGSISGYAASIDAAVEAVRRASGLPPLLVCHSMGGLAARAWLASRASGLNAPASAQPLVHGIVTIGSPHRGTWLARFGQTLNTAQMREGSPWLARLNVADGAHAASPFFICWFSNCDHIVFPASTATMPHADNRLVRRAAHVQLAFMPQVMDRTLALLDESAQAKA